MPLTIPNNSQVPLRCWVGEQEFSRFDLNGIQTCELVHLSQVLLPLDHSASKHEGTHSGVVLFVCLI